MYQEDGLLTQLSKYFSSILVTKRKSKLLQQYLIKEIGDYEKARHKISTLAVPLGIRKPESRSEPS